MKKIGFVDYFLYEWHANNYPAFIKNVSDDYEVCCAYGKIDASPHSGVTNTQWSEKYNIPLVDTIEEVIEKCDYIVVLSPDNAEMHEELAYLPLASGKPVYIDKAFAPDSETAKRIFARAESFNTPVCSASALNFSDELKEFNRDNISFIRAIADGRFETHLIHEIEPIVVLMGEGANRVMYTGNDTTGTAIVEFPGNRLAHLTIAKNNFLFDVCYEDGTVDSREIKSPFFDNFIRAMLNFFETKTPFVSKQQTIAVIEIIEAINKAKATPFTWVDIKK